MKMIVCGNLIDIKFIYQITEVKMSTCWFGDEGYEKPCPIGYFTINFINKKELSIEGTGNKAHKQYFSDNYKKDEKILEDQLNAVRNKLISEWTKNQLSIQKIEFNESETT